MVPSTFALITAVANLARLSALPCLLRSRARIQNLFVGGPISQKHSTAVGELRLTRSEASGSNGQDYPLDLNHLGRIQTIAKDDRPEFSGGNEAPDLIRLLQKNGYHYDERLLILQGHCMDVDFEKYF